MGCVYNPVGRASLQTVSKPEDKPLTPIVDRNASKPVRGVGDREGGHAARTSPRGLALRLILTARPSCAMPPYRWRNFMMPPFPTFLI